MTDQNQQASEAVETLHSYLIRNIKAGVIDFAIRAEEQPGATVKFYIHPSHVSGDTRDFLLWEDPENGSDLLMNEQKCPKPDPENFRKLLREHAAKVKDNELACPTCGHAPDTHRKRQIRHLHCKSEGMVKFISEIQGVLGVNGGFERMISEVKSIKENNTRALTPKCDAEAVERIADDTATRLYIAWGTRPNNPGRMVDFIAPFIKAAITQALQSRDAENDQDKTAREIAWDAVTHIRENNLPIEGSYLVNYFEQAIERGKAAIAQELARVKKDSERLDWLETQDTIPTHAGYRVCIGHGRCLRQAIDRAIAEEKGEEKK